MKTRILVALVLTAILAVSCSSTKDSVLPLSSGAAKPDLTLIWKGHGDAYIYKDGAYVRSTSNDYDFVVVQNRFQDHWQSEKVRHYLDPAYNGSAGDRDQFMYFGARYELQGDRVKSELDSSLGQGTGQTDKEFRKASFTIELKNNGFAPFNRFRISQEYRYEEGKLEELVELYLEKDGKEIPFMKIEEHALMFGQKVFEKAPSRIE